MKSLEFEETPAPRDTRLEDRPNEIWVDLPSLENYFEVSNHGRVKRKKREQVNLAGRRFSAAEKIMVPAINRDLNSFHNDYTYRFQFTFQLKGVNYSFQAQRLVYYCFVEKFDLKGKGIYIVTKDGNGLDIRPENLIKITLKEKNQIAYAKGRMYSHFTLDHESKMRTVKASVALTSKRVSQYSLDGKHIATFKSIFDAVRTIGVRFHLISKAVRSPLLTPGGFYWRFGNSQDFKMEIQPVGDVWKGIKKKVTKFDLEGNPMECYLSLAEAARLNSVTAKTIMTHINRSTPHIGGFIWRLGHHKEKLILEINK